MSVLQIVRGASRYPKQANDLAQTISRSISSGTLYLGYPVLSSAQQRVPIDALLISQECGFVAFIIGKKNPERADDDEWGTIIDDQDQLYAALEVSLGRHPSLRQRRKLALQINTVTVFPLPVTIQRDDFDSGTYVGLDQVKDALESFTSVDQNTYKKIEAAIQRVTTIKPAKKRNNVKNAGSYGSTLKSIEKGIANLDQWQKKAAIEIAEGPQRIRGLAGSGKTIVLALKAAYLHTQNPDWTIVVTFQTRSLYQQFLELIRRFTYEHINDEPDFTKLKVLHAWGSNDRGGVYRTLAKKLNAEPLHLTAAMAKYGRNDAFSGACEELVELIKYRGEPKELFDAILVDEAQDLPASFFQLIYKFTKDPKRIVWAYDELQSLKDESMPSTAELFGSDKEGNAVVKLQHTESEARQDIILPMCYRNPPWTLSIAHALGFGIYKQGGLVQHFSEPALWNAVGYEVIQGNLELGRQVELRRSKDSTPKFFHEQLKPTESVMFTQFNADSNQLLWLAESIRNDIDKNELEPDDILIILPNVYTSKSRAEEIISFLRRYKLNAHHVGVTSTTDEVFSKNSIAIAHIHRAKGNEAPMVYVVDADYIAQKSIDKFGASTKRNILFTAITRSKAWVRVSGLGRRMSSIMQEYQEVTQQNYHLNFRIPTLAELDQMRSINRDKSEAEHKTIKKGVAAAESLLSLLKNQSISVHDLDDDVMEDLRKLLLKGQDNDEA